MGGQLENYIHAFFSLRNGETEGSRFGVAVDEKQ